MKKLTILFLACLFTNVAVINTYDHPQDGSCKSCEPHKEKECDVCCCVDHISAASEANGLDDILSLFTPANGLNFVEPSSIRIRTNISGATYEIG